MTPWTAAGQASLSITNCWCLLTFMSTESVMPSNHLLLCHPLLLPSIFPNEESKLLQFVSFREKSLWKSPDLTPPPANQSEPLASLGNLNQAREMGTNQHLWPAQETRTNQNSTPNPSPEGDQSDPETPVFRIFPARIPYISNVTQSSGLLPIAAASVSVGAPARAW